MGIIKGTLKMVAEVVIIFLVIKLAFIPLAGYALGTQYPIVAILSGSMDHNGSFDNWWNAQSNLYGPFNITKDEFKTFQLSNGVHRGDAMILGRANNIEVGDIIVFIDTQNNIPIIHRVVSLVPLETKGDANLGQIQGVETNIPSETIIGKVVLEIPYVGYVKVGLVELLNYF